jgi:hypothetical protein
MVIINERKDFARIPQKPRKRAAAPLVLSATATDANKGAHIREMGNQR